MHRPDIVIVTPALAEANNGNWQTAQRWAGMLSRAYRVRLQTSWQFDEAAVLIALHARRSADSIARWKALRPERPCVVVLTGTDLYRDIARDASARRSLDLADRLVVLNELGADALPAALRPKARVLLQSCGARTALAKTGRRLRALMVGHLREEKGPRAYFEAAALLSDRADIRLDHVGAALDPGLGEQAREAMAAYPDYRWLGALGHEATRRRIRAAHVLVHPSRMEGGAHVVIEAVRSGTPVLASRIDGNVGLLGADYDGYFPVDDAAGLADRLRRLRDDPAMLAAWCAQCRARSPLFEPARESRGLHGLLSDLLRRPLVLESFQ